MLVINNINKYKDCDLKIKNLSTHKNNKYYTKIKILNSNISDFKINDSCLDNKSIIQNFFKNDYLFNVHVDKLDISHKKYYPYKYNNIHLLPDNEFISNVLKDFDNYLKFHSDNPAIAVVSDLYNNQFSFRLLNRFENPIRNIKDLSVALNGYKDKGVFLTLTYKHDIKLSDSWLNVSGDWNKFLTRLTIELQNNPYKTKLHLTKSKNINLKEYYNDLNKLNPNYYFTSNFLGFDLDLDNNLSFNLDYLKKLNNFKSPLIHINEKFKRSNLHYVMVLEAQKNGYVHIHVLFLGIEYLFNSGNKNEWLNDNPHSKNIKHFWGHGSIFINKTKSGSNIRSPVKYMFKYIRKIWSKKPDYKAKLTLAMLWYFGKRSFNKSKFLLSYLNYSKNSSLVYSKMDLSFKTDYYRLNHAKTSFNYYSYFIKNDILKSGIDYIDLKIHKDNKPLNFRKHSFFTLNGIDLYKKLNGQNTPLVWLTKSNYNFFDFNNHSEYKHKDKEFYNSLTKSYIVYFPVNSNHSNKIKEKTCKYLFDSQWVNSKGLLINGFIINKWPLKT